MNFSHNLLQGPVPRGTQFQRQKCSSFLDNPKLFGLEEICAEPHILYPPSQQTEEQSESDEPMFSWIAASVAYVPGVFCGLGVTCDDKSGQVISLNLVDTFRHLKLSCCNIQGDIPSSLGNLSRLTLIELSHNCLVGEIPASIGNLKGLRHVELGANTLIGAIPSSLGKLNQLRYLSLAENELTGEIPSCLLELRLSINHLVGQVPASIGNLNDLQIISLS
ncbi:hypothetical protein F2Q69_00020508 [Brassica cretica]|uniref:Leucine-rich repeat-containing N-terminal plant-type domain-containing protein n=1 Tax=Brassica cretica TaxID=69181 RepID=A0A8S9QFD1_BRACR|nr:hypothetical protein F2Q69_00020508 [Brassica cretica]